MVNLAPHHSSPPSTTIHHHLAVAILKTIVTRCLRSYCATCCPTWVSTGCKKCCSMLDDAQDAVGDAVSSAAGSKPPASKSDRAGFFPTSAMV